MVELPLVMSMGDLVRLCNLGVPARAPGHVDAEKLGYWFTKHQIPSLPRGGNKEHLYFEVTELERKWPTFVGGLRAKLARYASGPEAVSAFEEDDEGG